jgi:hypothetical protein
MIENLSLAVAMVCATVAIHFGGLILLLRILRRRGHRFRAHESVFGEVALIMFVMLGIFAIHTAEIWLYAAVYRAIGAVVDFETALYFSTSTFTTLGYGDVILPKEWQLFGSIEAANGLVLFGWSTAFLLSVTTRLRTLEHDWLEPRDETAPPG